MTIRLTIPSVPTVPVVPVVPTVHAVGSVPAVVEPSSWPVVYECLHCLGYYRQTSWYRFELSSTPTFAWSCRIEDLSVAAIEARGHVLVPIGRTA